MSLVLLAGVDAAWSGDWSRIGAISKDTELFLQSALTAAGAWHLFMGLCAYIIADQNDHPWLPVTAKVMARFGAVVLFVCSEDNTTLNRVSTLTFCPCNVCLQALAVGTLPVLELILDIQSEE